MHQEAFINYLRYEKRLSSHTVIAYSNDLEQFFIYLKNVYSLDDIKEVNHSFIRSWVVSLMEHKITARSVNRKISTLKSFYKYLLREKVLEINPMHKIQSPKNPKRLPVFVEESKMNSLIEDVSFSNDFEGRRNLLIIELLYSTGMRRAELVNLKESDFNFQNNTVKVLGKRNKERLIPITDGLKVLINEYTQQRNKSVQAKDDFLFLTEKGNQIYPPYTAL
jgi:integrase/recombinase XerC